MGVTLITIKRLTSDCLMHRYKVLIKVKDEDSAITVSTEKGLSGCYQLNSMKNTCINLSLKVLHSSLCFISKKKERSS